MTTHRRIHHVHTSWPAPATGLIASALFAAVLVYILLLMLTRA